MNTLSKLATIPFILIGWAVFSPVVCAQSGSTAAPAATTSATSTPAATTTTTTTSTTNGPSAIAPSTGSIFPATSRQQALTNARKSAGRSDPLAPITGFKPFPSGAEEVKPVLEKDRAAQPQSQTSNRLPAGVGEGLVPPPPPVSMSSSSSDELPVSELPLPPDKPSIAAKLKLTGIIGNKAIFAITDKEAIKQNKWPGVLMMGEGDRFESIETISVGADSAVLEEDGERSTKTLERIR